MCTCMYCVSSGRVLVTLLMLLDYNQQSWLLCLQLHASQESEAGCSSEGRLQIRQQDLVSIFVTSTAEMPGMLFASLLVDAAGRKR